MDFHNDYYGGQSRPSVNCLPNIIKVDIKDEEHLRLVLENHFNGKNYWMGSNPPIFNLRVASGDITRPLHITYDLMPMALEYRVGYGNQSLIEQIVSHFVDKIPEWQKHRENKKQMEKSNKNIENKATDENKRLLLQIQKLNFLITRLSFELQSKSGNMPFSLNDLQALSNVAGDAETLAHIDYLLNCFNNSDLENKNNNKIIMENQVFYLVSPSSFAENGTGAVTEINIVSLTPDKLIYKELGQGRATINAKGEFQFQPDNELKMMDLNKSKCFIFANKESAVAKLISV